PSTCGNAGSACVACSAALADNCGASGACQCGAAAACVPGQRCLSGACVCDATSCPVGCCTNNTCASRTLSTCGLDGGACVACAACDLTRADNCTNGACGCGAGGICGASSACDGGVCVAPACPAGALLCDDFELGNFSRWNGTLINYGSASASGPPSYAGAKSLHASTPANPPGASYVESFVYKTALPTAGMIAARAYFSFPQALTNTTQVMYFFP